MSTSIFGWNADISAHMRNGQGKKALELFHHMLRQGVTPDKGTYVLALKACINIKDLMHGRLIHAQISKSSLKSDIVVGSSLIDMYAKCGQISLARSVFEKLDYRNVVSWSTMIVGYVNSGQGIEALQLFDRMQREGTRPDRVLFLCVLKACYCLEMIRHGRSIHSQIMVNNFESDVALGSSLVDFYAKCGSMEEAHCVFERLKERNVVTWSTLISGYANHEDDMMAFQVFEKMQLHGVKPGRVAFLSILKVCGNMKAIGHGRLIHHHVLKECLDTDHSLGSTLIDMYGKCGSLSEARSVFESLPQKTVFSYGAMMTSYAQHGHGLLAIDLFARMQKHDMKPDRVIFIAILIACANAKSLDQGKLIHYELIGTTLELDVSVGTALIDMYVKCGSVSEAWEVFKKLPARDEVMWNTVLTGYIENGYEHSILQLLKEMQEDNIKPDAPLFLCLLKTCASIRALMEGRLIHKQIINSGLHSDMAISCGLVDMYSKCSSMKDAQHVFNASFEHDAMPWGVMIAGHAQHSQGFLALELYGKMLQEGLDPEGATFVCALKACCSAGALEQGKLIHAQIIERGLQTDNIIGNTLINFYAKCIRLEDAQKTFDALLTQDVVSWSVLITGYALAGNYDWAKHCLNAMQKKGLKPDSVIFTTVLSTFGHGGLIEEGRQCLKSMTKEFGIRPGIEHYNCIIDVLSRLGQLKEARAFMEGMPVSPNVTSWMSLLTGCRTFGDRDQATECLDEIVRLDPDKASTYVMISGICADIQKWDEAEKFHELKNCASAWKEPGKAWIEVEHRVYEFFVGDRPLNSEMHAKLNRVRKIMTVQGSVPHASFIMT